MLHATSQTKCVDTALLGDPCDAKKGSNFRFRERGGEIVLISRVCSLSVGRSDIHPELRPRARLFPLLSSDHNSCPWNGNEEVGGIGAAETNPPPPPRSGLRDRKEDEDAAVGSAENGAEEGDDDGSLEWAELLLTTRQAR